MHITVLRLLRSLILTLSMGTLLIGSNVAFAQNTVTSQLIADNTPQVKVTLPEVKDITLKGSTLSLDVQVGNDSAYPIDSVKLVARISQPVLTPTTFTDPVTQQTTNGVNYEPVAVALYAPDQIYDLASKSVQKIHLSIPLPSTLADDKYDLEIRANDAHGVTRGSSSTSLPMNYKGSDQQLSLKSGSEYLLDTTNQKKLDYNQGIVAPGTGLSLNFVLTNSHATPVTGQPTVKVIAYGKTDTDQDVLTQKQSSLTVAANSEQTVSYTLPSLTKPGLYTVQASFANSSDGLDLVYPVTDAVTISGPSGGIINSVYSVTGKNIFISNAQGHIYVAGSADRKSELKGTVTSTIYAAKDNKKIGEQTEKVDIQASSPFAEVPIKPTFFRPLGGSGDIIIKSVLKNADGTVIDITSSTYHPTYTYTDFLKVLGSVLLALAIFVLLKLFLNRRRKLLLKMSPALGLVVLLFVVATGMLIGPQYIAAHPNIGNAAARHQEGLTWTLNNTGIGVGSKAVGGTTVNGDQYSNYLTSNNGGVAISTITVNPGWGSQWKLGYAFTGNYCSTRYDSGQGANIVSGACNFDSYSVAHLGPVYGNLVSYVHSGNRGYGSDHGGINFVCGNDPDQFNDDFSGSFNYNTCREVRPAVYTDLQNPQPLYGLPLSDGSYDYSQGNDENTWDDAPRQFWFPSITPTIQGDLIACNNDSAFTAMGGAAGFSSKTVSTQYTAIRSRWIDPVTGLPSAYQSVTNNRDGSITFSVAACTGIHSGSYAGRATIKFNLTEDSFFYEGSPNGGNGDNGDNNYISNNYVASLIRLWGGGAKPSNMGGDRSLYDFASHLHDGSWDNPTWTEESPAQAADLVGHANAGGGRTNLDGSNNGFGSAQNWDQFYPIQDPEMNLFTTCQAFNFYNYNPGSPAAANPNSAYYQHNQGLVNPVPTESAATYKNNYQANCQAYTYPIPNPTVSFKANGSNNLTTNYNASLNFVWSSTNATYLKITGDGFNSSTHYPVSSAGTPINVGRSQTYTAQACFDASHCSSAVQVVVHVKSKINDARAVKCGVSSNSGANPWNGVDGTGVPYGESTCVFASASNVNHFVFDLMNPGDGSIQSSTSAAPNSSGFASVAYSMNRSADFKVLACSDASASYCDTYTYVHVNTKSKITDARAVKCGLPSSSGLNPWNGTDGKGVPYGENTCVFASASNVNHYVFRLMNPAVTGVESSQTVSSDANGFGAAGYAMDRSAAFQILACSDTGTSFCAVSGYVRVNVKSKINDARAVTCGLPNASNPYSGSDGSGIPYGSCITVLASASNFHQAVIQIMNPSDTGVEYTTPILYPAANGYVSFNFSPINRTVDFRVTACSDTANAFCDVLNYVHVNAKAKIVDARAVKCGLPASSGANPWNGTDGKGVPYGENTCVFATGANVSHFIVSLMKPDDSAIESSTPANPDANGFIAIGYTMNRSADFRIVGCSDSGTLYCDTINYVHVNTKSKINDARAVTCGSPVSAGANPYTVNYGTPCVALFAGAVNVNHIAFQLMTPNDSAVDPTGSSANMTPDSGGYDYFGVGPTDRTADYKVLACSDAAGNYCDAITYLHLEVVPTISLTSRETSILKNNAVHLSWTSDPDATYVKLESSSSYSPTGSDTFTPASTHTYVAQACNANNRLTQCGPASSVTVTVTSNGILVPTVPVTASKRFCDGE